MGSGIRPGVGQDLPNLLVGPWPFQPEFISEAITACFTGEEGSFDKICAYCAYSL